jgi:TnpA family transposase
LVSRTDQTINAQQITEQWDCMGQLYASLGTGHVTASVALKRLVGFSTKNRFYRANQDLGHILKTEFTLDLSLFALMLESKGFVRLGNVMGGVSLA